jgi:predicted nucleic acid-binding protein
MFREAALADLARLDICVDSETSNFAWPGTVQLADRFGLTVYDAVYLELAQRRSLPLGSLDNASCAAARTLGVPVIGD